MSVIFVFIRVFFDVIAIGGSFILVQMVKGTQDPFSMLIANNWDWLIFVIFLYPFIFYLFGLYRSRKGFLIEVDELVEVFLAVIVAWAVSVVGTFLLGQYTEYRGSMLLALPIRFIMIIFCREVILTVELWLRKKGFGAERAVIIGTGDLAQSFGKKISNNPAYGIKLLGFISNVDSDGAVLGKVSDLDRLIAQYQVQSVYVTGETLSREDLAGLASVCDTKNVELKMHPDVFAILTTVPLLGNIDGQPMVSLKQSPLNRGSRILKRTFDICLSVFGIIVFSIPMVLIACLIRMTSPGGAAIYKQERVGRKGIVFDLYKFRTMIPDAEKATGPVLATADDPRKTLLGKVLRKTNLDELPQLFNILKGDMSFVGPRPERPVFVEEFKQVIPQYMERHKIRSGLAGWAQLHGGYNLPAEDKIKYDLYYIENWSFLLDIKIILKYIQIAFTGQREN
ncbi:MAG: sugar transferase [Candidatus Saganbacteria bacterium]|nr:sugar transferase [Candidatus Saganbacteria bacterium]